MRSLRNQLQGNLPVLDILGIGINTTKFEKTLIHYKSDVFASVAVVAAKSPFFRETQSETNTDTPKYRQLRRLLNPLNPIIKIQNLICCPYMFSIEVVGRIC